MTASLLHERSLSIVANSSRILHGALRAAKNQGCVNALQP